MDGVISGRVSKTPSPTKKRAPKAKETHSTILIKEEDSSASSVVDSGISGMEDFGVDGSFDMMDYGLYFDEN